MRGMRVEPVDGHLNPRRARPERGAGDHNLRRCSRDGPYHTLLPRSGRACLRPRSGSGCSTASVEAARQRLGHSTLLTPTPYRPAGRAHLSGVRGGRGDCPTSFDRLSHPSGAEEASVQAGRSYATRSPSTRQDDPSPRMNAKSRKQATTGGRTPRRFVHGGA